MKKSPFIVFLPLFLIGACSSDNDAPIPEASSTEAVKTQIMPAETAAPQQVSPSNPFSTQLNALESAKQVSGAANSTIDKHQQELDRSAP